MTFNVEPRSKLKGLPSSIEKIFSLFLKDITHTGLAVTDGGGLNANVGTGKATIKGYYAEITSPESHTLSASQTNWLYLKLKRNVNGEVDTDVNGSAELVHLTGATEPSPPADAVLLAKIVTGASSITSIDETVKWTNLNKDTVVKHGFQHSSSGGDPINNKELYFPGAILTAAAALNAKDAVIISGNNQINKSNTDANRKKCVGVIIVNKNVNDPVNEGELLIYGVTDVVYDGTVAAGDNLVLSTGTAGRVVAENSMPTHQHAATGLTFTGNALGTHTHTFIGNALPTHQHISHRYSGQVSEAGAFTTEVRHGDGSAAGGLRIRYSVGTPGSINTNAVSAGTPSGTNDAVSAGTPSGSIGGNTAPITSGDHGRVIGKAIEGGIAGETHKALICLAG